MEDNLSNQNMFGQSDFCPFVCQGIYLVLIRYPWFCGLTTHRQKKTTKKPKNKQKQKQTNKQTKNPDLN